MKLNSNVVVIFTVEILAFRQVLISKIQNGTIITVFDNNIMIIII